MRVRFTPSGRRQFFAALKHIRRDRPAAARNFRLTAHQHLKRLVRFPLSGRSIPEFPDPRFREVVVAPYRFFYFIEGKNVWITAVWPGAQIPEDPGEAD